MGNKNSGRKKETGLERFRKYQKAFKEFTLVANGKADEEIMKMYENLQLLLDEEYEHCICKDFDKEYYCEEFVITNKGRIWSLDRKKWLVPNRDYEGYSKIGNNIYVHRLVDFYFMNEKEEMIRNMIVEHNEELTPEIEQEIEENTELSDYEKKQLGRWKEEVHHITPIDKELERDYVNKQLSDEERIAICMRENNKENLMLAIKEVDHLTSVHNIMKGLETEAERQEKYKMQEKLDSFTSIIRNSKPEEVFVTYDENGNRQYNMTKYIKGTTPFEDLVYSELEKRKGRSCYKFDKTEYNECERDVLEKIRKGEISL